VTFGQASGFPASARQLDALRVLLQAAGYTDFRDARGPMRFTQRQAGGKFTSDEAAAFIAQLEEAGEGAEVVARPAPSRPSAMEQTLRRAPAEALAAELQRRGWIVVEP
jgi:hypothetical protein